MLEYYSKKTQFKYPNTKIGKRGSNTIMGECSENFNKSFFKYIILIDFSYLIIRIFCILYFVFYLYLIFLKVKRLGIKQWMENEL